MSKKGFRQKMNVFFSVPSWSVLLFLEVPVKKEPSSFFFEPMFLRIPGNSGDSLRNAQPSFPARKKVPSEVWLA